MEGDVSMTRGREENGSRASSNSNMPYLLQVTFASLSSHQLALPFLVCKVGFEKPIRLARAVFGNSHLIQPAIQEGRLHGQMKPALDIIVEVLDKASNIIVRDKVSRLPYFSSVHIARSAGSKSSVPSLPSS